ncbi:MAG: phosphoribosylanthranilate isomerase [Epulopiscium sp.]|nr:phosphoribosylanthranilate isomerase [Candidatus Epulonipiscium sp.]
MVQIKICGITREEEISIINTLPIHYIGFVFAQSKRKIQPQKALRFQQQLQPHIQKVGIFMDQPISQVKEIARYCKLDIIQLHGKESDSYCKAFHLPIWKSFTIKERADIAKIKNEIQKTYIHIEGILLDSRYGGSGTTFEWEWIKREAWSRKLILAGGLKKENVKKAISIVRPQIIDVSSGVEEEGVKSPRKIKEFVEVVINE